LPEAYRLSYAGGDILTLFHDRGNHRSFGVPCTTEDKRKADLPFLDSYATKQWEAILHFMVGTRNDIQPGSGVIQLLLKSGLMEKCDPSIIPSIAFSY